MSRRRDDPSRSHPLRIAVGVIEDGGRFLVARRAAGRHLAGTWEFPGGKAAADESIREALRRELIEEVGVRCDDAVLLHVEEHDYGDRHVEIHFFLCSDVLGEPAPLEGQELRWSTLEELDRRETPAANRALLTLLRDHFGAGG